MIFEFCIRISCKINTKQSINCNPLMNPERLELLRKREELLKFKEKLIQVKNKWQNQLEETSSTTTNHLQLKWHNGLLAVLKDDQIILKSFNGTWRGDKVLKLPENSDEMIFHLKTNCIAISCKQDDLRYKNYWIPLDRSDSNWVGLPEDSRQRIESIQVLREDAKVIRALMFEDQKKVLTIINERMEILEEIEEVERILESNESDCSSVLLIKSDKSLSIL